MTSLPVEHPAQYLRPSVLKTSDRRDVTPRYTHTRTHAHARVVNPPTARVIRTAE